MIKLVLTICFIFSFSTNLYAASLEELFSAAQSAYQEKKYDEAIGNFTQVVSILLQAKEYANAQTVLNNIAVIYIANQDYAKALTSYEQALSLPNKASDDFLLKAYQNMAVCHHNLGNIALKIQTLNELVKIKKIAKAELANNYAQLGDAYRALEIYVEAEKAYTQANSLLDKNASASLRGTILTALGLCQSNIGNFTQAEANFKLARDLASISNQKLLKAEANSNLGILYLEKGDYENAIKMLTNSLHIEKEASLRRNEGVDRNNLGLVLKSVGKYSEANHYLDCAIDIAKEIGNKKDEAIALSNRALVARIQGNLEAARVDYNLALKLYDEVNFLEGRASTLLGLGKISEVVDNNYQKALQYYQEALGIYEKLFMLRGQAETQNQIGRILKKLASPQRLTRDLVFSDEDIEQKISPEEAITMSQEAYAKALEISEPLQLKEIIWSARQGLGFALYEQGKLEEALVEYSKAIEIVTSMRGNKANIELLSNYLADKQDLFNEAIEICYGLYEKTKEEKYIVQQLEYDEILRNEITKANMALVQMNYDDPNKQDIYQKIIATNNARDKVISALPVKATQAEDDEQKKVEQLQETNAQELNLSVQKLDKIYNELLAEWKQKYPADAVMFDSNAKIDTNQIQNVLAANECLISYMDLPDQLIITTITKENIQIVSSKIPKKELNAMIRDDFVYKVIEGHRDVYSNVKTELIAMEKVSMEQDIQLLHEFYNILIRPIENVISQKEKLIFVTSGYLSQLPFVALVKDASNPLIPVFLAESKIISYARLSFIDQMFKTNIENKKVDSILAVGNPINNYIEMASLEGAKRETENCISTLKLNEKVSVAYEADAKESWWKNNFASNSYGILYFATHGMPYSEVYLSYFTKEFKSKKMKNQKLYLEKNLVSYSMLNSYLYMANDNTDISSSNDGLLTIREIMELPEITFKDVNAVILSACNTGVSFAPKTFADEKVEEFLSASEIEAELMKTGWTPGVDQISFVDTFMKRGVQSVYGTLWFADDAASAYLMSEFIKNFNNDNNATLAYGKTLQEYISQAKTNINILGQDYTTTPLHPFFWAVGGIFGR